MQFSSKIQKRILYEILIQFLNQFIIFAAVLVCRICFISGWNHCQWTMCAHVSGIWSISERWLCTKFWGKAHFSLKLYYFVCKTNEIFMYARIIYCVALCSRTPLCWWYCRWQWNISMILAWWTSRPWTIWRVRKICGATFFSLTPFSHWKSGYVHRTYMTHGICNQHTYTVTHARKHLRCKCKIPTIEFIVLLFYIEIAVHDLVVDCVAGDSVFHCGQHRFAHTAKPSTLRHCDLLLVCNQLICGHHQHSICIGRQTQLSVQMNNWLLLLNIEHFPFISHHQHTLTMNLYCDSLLLDEHLAAFNGVYEQPWTRISPYFFGICLGYILHKADDKLKINWVTLTCGWIACLFLFAAILFSKTVIEFSNRWMNATMSVAHHTIWSMILFWIILASITQYRGDTSSISQFSFPFTIQSFCIEYMIYWFCDLRYHRPICGLQELVAAEQNY